MGSLAGDDADFQWGVGTNVASLARQESNQADAASVRPKAARQG